MVAARDTRTSLAEEMPGSAAHYASPNYGFGSKCGELQTAATSVELKELAKSKNRPI
jgi:hypothetical protein